MSCCSNQPALGSTLLCDSGEHGGVVAGLGRWCRGLCVKGEEGSLAVCRLLGSVCAKARLMLCVATEYK